MCARRESVRALQHSAALSVEPATRHCPREHSSGMWALTRRTSHKGGRGHQQDGPAGAWGGLCLVHQLAALVRCGHIAGFVRAPALARQARRTAGRLSGCKVAWRMLPAHAKHSLQLSHSIVYLAVAVRECGAFRVRPAGRAAGGRRRLQVVVRWLAEWCARGDEAWQQHAAAALLWALRRQQSSLRVRGDDWVGGGLLQTGGSDDGCWRWAAAVPVSGPSLVGLSHRDNRHVTKATWASSMRPGRAGLRRRGGATPLALFPCRLLLRIAIISMNKSRSFEQTAIARGRWAGPTALGRRSLSLVARINGKPLLCRRDAAFGAGKK